MEPATPRMGAVPVLQAGLDPTAWKVPIKSYLADICEETAVRGSVVTPPCLLGCLQAAHLECLVSTAPSYASVVLERSATQRLGPVPVPGDTVVHPAEWVSFWTHCPSPCPRFWDSGPSYHLFFLKCNPSPLAEPRC